MLRTFIKNISIYGILPILGKFMNFILVPVFAKTFSPEQYGIIDLFDALVFFLLVVASMEIPTAMGRFFYEEDNIEHRRKIVNTSLFLTIIFVVLTLSVALVFKKPLLEKFLGGIQNGPMFPIALVWLFSLTINTFLSFIPRYDNRPKVYVSVGIISIAVKLVSSILFVVVFKTGLMGVLYGYICGNTVSLLIYAYLSRHYFRLVFSLKYAGKMMVYALPLLLGCIMLEVWKPLLRHFIALYYPAMVVGFYAFAIRITSVNMIVHGAFKTAWKPLLFENKDVFVKGDSMKRISGLVAIASVFIGCMITCFAKEATLVLGNRDYIDSVSLIALLSVSGIIQMMCELRGFAPYTSDRTYVVTIANVVAIAASSAFLIFLHNQAGIYAIGFACILYELVCYLVLVAYTCSKYHISLHNKWEIILAAILALCVILSTAEAQFKYRLAVAVFSCLCAAYLFFSRYYKVKFLGRITG